MRPIHGVCLVLVAAALVAGCATRAERDPAPPDETGIARVLYKSWKESVDVDLVGRTIARSRTEYTYPSRTSGTPSSARTISEPPKALDAAKAREIADLVNSSDFRDLAPAHGAPEDQRFYPYRITVTYADGSRHDVLFRSNPDYEGKPEAFTTPESFLLGLGTD